jgi:PleD family two-component response regulator
MFQRADEAMYHSKQQGRDRVSIASPLAEGQAVAA